MDSTTMANAALQDILKYQEITTSYPLGPTQATTGIFVPISYLSGNAYTGDKVKVYKTYKDLNGGILEKDDIVQVTVHITATQSFQGSFGDKIQ
ncbi:MAG: hypothetical protein LBG59_02630 [Candidatus Peribacteria bacterium]|jgi:hypothetical protein|nr:hypothetical protein [Candidatus Peribacteria bacterium]